MRIAVPWMRMDDKNKDSSSSVEGTRGGGNSSPVNRRGHRLCIHRVEGDGGEETEYLIVTGGFSASGLKVSGVSGGEEGEFPVWAFDVTHAWPLESGSVATAQSWFRLGPSSLAEAVAPQDRVGHVSVVRKGYLYVFGGLSASRDVRGQAHYTLADGTEHAYVYRARLFSSTDDKDNFELFWERINPQIVARVPDTSSWRKASKPVDLGSFAAEGTRDGPAARALPRGYATGGHWPQGDALVIYGGVDGDHFDSPGTDSTRRRGAKGDVWMYHYDEETFVRLFDPHIAATPEPRFLHAGTIGDNELIIHGGTAEISILESQKRRERLGEGDEALIAESTLLQSTWSFDLNMLRWIDRTDRRTSARRCFHTMVAFPAKSGIEDAHPSTTVLTFGGERLSVFGGTWTPLLTITDGADVSVMNIAREDSSGRNPGKPAWFHGEPHDFTAPPSRFDHAAVVDSNGRMYVWGGAHMHMFASLDGLWGVDLARVLNALPPESSWGNETSSSSSSLLWATRAYNTLSTTHDPKLSASTSTNNSGSEGGGGWLALLVSIVILLLWVARARGQWHNRAQRQHRRREIWATIQRQEQSEALRRQVLLEIFRQIQQAQQEEAESAQGLSQEQMDQYPVIVYQGRRGGGSDEAEEEEKKGEDVQKGESKDSAAADEETGSSAEHDAEVANESEISHDAASLMETTSTMTKDNASGETRSTGQAEDQMGNNNDENDDDDCCIICLSNYQVGDEIRQMPCRHEFHKACLDMWLKDHASCPACRFGLDERQAPGTQSGSNATEGATTTTTAAHVSIATTIGMPAFFVRRLRPVVIRGGQESTSSSSSNGEEAMGVEMAILRQP